MGGRAWSLGAVKCRYKGWVGPPLLSGGKGTKASKLGAVNVFRCAFVGVGVGGLLWPFLSS